MPGAESLHVAIAAKSFGARPVLADIGFAAAPGEVLALVAPSGTGKTTALRIVLGLDRDFSGSVRRPTGRTGAVFQEPRLLPWLNVAANLRLVAPMLTDDEVENLLAIAGLPGAAARMPNRISLGMARRVALARALAVQPALLMMDEPFASLDPRLAAAVSRDAIDHARRLGCITLLATHDLDQAMQLADRVLVLGGQAPATLAADIATTAADAAAIRHRFPFLATATQPW
jgi:NitT/TauT family transport system ATP-binding protein